MFICTSRAYARLSLHLWTVQDQKRHGAARHHRPQMGAGVIRGTGTVLTETGMDASDLYHMTRDDQTALIKQVTEDTLPQKELDNLTELMKEEGLTIPTGHGKVEVQDDLTAAISADSRDELGEIKIRSTTKIQQGFSAFAPDDPLYRNIQFVQPDGDKFDVGMHGSPTAVAFGGKTSNMSPGLLASIIKHNKDYRPGQEVRLLSCQTGVQVNGDYCFAEELANSLGATVWAPNDEIRIFPNGVIKIGDFDQGKFIPFAPNERRRVK